MTTHKPDSHPAAPVTRRSFITMGGTLALGSLVASVIPTDVMAATLNSKTIEHGARRLSFRNQHTGEIFSGVYRVGDKYLPDAFDQINMVMRDFRSNEVFPIDPRVIDIIYTVHRQTGKNEPYEVLSGYRCPKTNAMLRKKSEGVAKNSLHMTGQAVDVRLDGFSTTQLRDLAKSLKAGGVGYYAKSNFVHMDSGLVRTW